MTDVASPLTQAILEGDPTRVAELLDTQVKIGEPELMALVKLAWAHRAQPEEIEQMDASERARQVYTLVADFGGNVKHMTNRGRIVDRIAAVQPDWPSAQDLDTGTPAVVRIEATSVADLNADDDLPSARPPRGAMHRRPR